MGTPFWTTELGIAGLTITSLITLTFYIVISSNRREDKRTTGFQEAMFEMHQLHKEERSEWREDANDALRELSKAINEMIIEHNNETKLHLR